MKPPIIVVEDGDVMIFQAVEDALRYCEVIDIKNGVYTVYDCEGYLLEFEVTEIKRPLFGIFPIKVREEKASIRVNAPLIDQSADLRVKLVQYLSFPKFGVPEDWLSNASLADLTERVSELSSG